MRAQQPTPDPYAVLGVPRDVTRADVDRAYRVMVRRYHPDSRTNIDPGHTATDDIALRDVMTAYRLLGDRKGRAAHDRRTSSGSPPAAPATVPRRRGAGAEAPLVRAGQMYWTPSRTAQGEPAPQSKRSSGLVNGWASSAAALNAPARTDDGHEDDASDGIWQTSNMDTHEISDRVRSLSEQVEQLTIARDTNRRIGIAMGIVMTRLRVNDGEAFEVLRRLSQNSNRKLPCVAEDIIRDRHIEQATTPGSPKGRGAVR